MDSLDIFQNNCVICLKRPAVLDWNEEIPDCETTYKYCYFIYTQLDDQDVFSQMLCETCAFDLKCTHFLIQKALESHRILRQTLRTNIIAGDKDTLHQVVDTTDFETVFIKQSPESLPEVQNGTKEKLTLSIDETTIKISKNLKKGHVDNKSKVQNISVENHNNNYNNNTDDLKKLEHISRTSENLNLPVQDKTKLGTTKAKNKKSHIMCPYCSKLIIAENIKLHEETHRTDRERTVVCPECGIKLYNKRTLYSHMLTHKKNREKKYKCEFCEKSYFNRGGLTVHQRIHLGQMKRCPICSKEFYRQNELDRHNVKTHSASLLHNSTNFNTNKYYFECKDCNKSIPSHKWKFHRDTHLKNFQMKCTLCDKHFVTKSSCHKHVRRVHKKDKEEYAKVVLYYGENIDARTSHLMIKQSEELKPILE